MRWEAGSAADGEQWEKQKDEMKKVFFYNGKWVLCIFQSDVCVHLKPFDFKLGSTKLILFYFSSSPLTFCSHPSGGVNRSE